MSLQFPGIRFQQVADPTTRAALADTSKALRAIREHLNTSFATDFGPGRTRAIRSVVLPDMEQNPTLRSTYGVVGELRRRGPDVYLKTGNEGADTDWQSVPTGATGFANPTAFIGLTPINGSATTFMRSDAAPALSQNIAPVWTALHTFTVAPIFPAASFGTAPANTVNISAPTPGVASTFLRSDATLQIDQSIAPIWTAGHQFAARIGVGQALDSVSRVAITADGTPTDRQLILSGNGGTTWRFYTDSTTGLYLNPDASGGGMHTTELMQAAGGFDCYQGVLLDIAGFNLPGVKSGRFTSQVPNTWTHPKIPSGSVSDVCVAFDLRDECANGGGGRTQDFTMRIRNTEAGQNLMMLSCDGQAAYGYGVTDVVHGAALGFALNDNIVPASGNPIYVGGCVQMQHNNQTLPTPVSVGFSASVLNATDATSFTGTILAGLRGEVALGKDSAFPGAVAAAITTDLVKTPQNPNTFGGRDRTLPNSNYPLGGFDHVTGLWCKRFTAGGAGNLYPTSLPGAVHSIRAPIQDWGASVSIGAPAGRLLAIFSDTPALGNLAQYPAETGYAIFSYPRRTQAASTRAYHVNWEPWPNTATTRANAAAGDTYFDSGTNFAPGLWQYAKTQWERLMSVGATQARAPIGTDDSSSGYGPGSVWLDSSQNAFYVCLSAAAGNAVWIQGGNDVATTKQNDLLEQLLNETKQMRLAIISLATQGGLALPSDFTPGYNDDEPGAPRE